MSGRTVATQIKTTEQPELPKEAQEQLEMDKLFFLDQENRGKMAFHRPLVPGEELPFKLHESAMVRVRPGAREFVVFDKQVLVIIETIKTKQRTPPKREPFGVKDIRSYYTEVRKERDKGKPQVVQLTAEQRQERKDNERARQEKRRQEREAKRDGVRAVKRADKLMRMAEQRARRERAGQEYHDPFEFESLAPAIVPSGNTA